jgi:hypothetical protein
MWKQDIVSIHVEDNECTVFKVGEGHLAGLVFNRLYKVGFTLLPCGAS